jgi:hypothetical protein
MSRIGLSLDDKGPGRIRAIWSIRLYLMEKVRLGRRRLLIRMSGIFYRNKYEAGKILVANVDMRREAT